MKGRVGWRGAAAGATLLAAALGWWWFGAGPGTGAAVVATAAAGSGPAPAGGGQPLSPASGAPPASPATAAAAAGATDPFLNPSLRHRLEALLLDAGEAADPAELKRKVAGLIDRHFTPDEATRAAQLVDRWIDYRIALSRLQPPADLADPHALRTALEARQRERSRHFTSQEWKALFAREDELDRFTIARVEIARNAALSADQKLQALRAAEAGLGTEERLARADAVAHLQVAAQSAAYEAAKVDAHQRYRERAQAHGDAAAQRLAELDRDEAHWQARIDRLAAAAPAEQAQLRAQIFTAEEQLRLDGALGLRQLKR